MKRSQIIKHIEDMDEVMERTAKRADIWQDRAVYSIADAVRSILLEEVKNGKHEDSKGICEPDEKR